MSTTVLVVTCVIEVGLAYCWMMGAFCKGLAWTSHLRRR